MAKKLSIDAIASERARQGTANVYVPEGRQIAWKSTYNEEGYNQNDLFDVLINPQLYPASPEGNDKGVGWETLPGAKWRPSQINGD